VAEAEAETEAEAEIEAEAEVEAEAEARAGARKSWYELPALRMPRSWEALARPAPPAPPTHAPGG